MSDTSTASLDRVCSAACTRAGITALLLSLFALSLLRPLTQVGALEALSAYAAARISLKAAADALDIDPCWQELRIQPDIEAISLKQLRTRHCGSMMVGDPKPRTGVQRPHSAKTSPQVGGSTDKRPPEAPSGLTILLSPQPLDEIEQALVVLGQRQSITRARSIFQYRFGFSIWRWERRASQLNMRRDINDNSPQVWDAKSYRFHENLTIRDVRLLASYEPLDAGAVEQVFTEETRINLPSAGNPLTLGTSTTFVEVGLLLCIIYFWLYQREAGFSPTFPAPGTIFAVFSRSRLPRFLFLLLASVPPSGALLLAWWSLKYVRGVNMALGILVLIFCALIARQAHTVNPRVIA